ncbi:MAG TPA: UBP-type zinc finger domain-containing protein [Anaerolineales bacterium]|nr:UBP-type zinc finger domain-containing protein [Anaerolineales bacterium]
MLVKPNLPVRSSTCSHLDLAREVTPSSQGCTACLQIGDKWVHLRICLICGQVGCCDNSKNKHATRHYQETGHPLIQSFQPDESWVWCYADQAYP